MWRIYARKVLLILLPWPVCERVNEYEVDEEVGRNFLKSPHLDILLLPLLRVGGAHRSVVKDLNAAIAKLSEEGNQFRRRYDEAQTRVEDAERALEQVTKERDEWIAKCKKAEEAGRADAVVRDRICSLLAHTLSSRQPTISGSADGMTATTIEEVDTRFRLCDDASNSTYADACDPSADYWLCLVPSQSPKLRPLHALSAYQVRLHQPSAAASCSSRLGSSSGLTQATRQSSSEDYPPEATSGRKVAQ